MVGQRLHATWTKRPENTLCGQDVVEGGVAPNAARVTCEKCNQQLVVLFQRYCATDLTKINLENCWPPGVAGEPLSKATPGKGSEFVKLHGFH